MTFRPPAGAGSIATLALFLFFFLALGFAATPVKAANPVRQVADRVVFQTKFLRWIVGTDGRQREFVDRRTGKNRIFEDEPGPFMILARGEELIESNAVELNGDLLSVGFGDDRVEVRVRAHPTYLTFEISAVEASGVDRLQLVRLPLTMTLRKGRSLAACRDTEFAAAVLPLNPETHTYVRPTRPALVIGEADHRVQLVGAGVAVLASPTGKLLSTIETVEIENGLPHPTLDGIWARQSPRQTESYLFVDISEDTAEAVIGYAKSGGFRTIVPYDFVWHGSHGTYPVNREYFPSGPAGLKAVSDKIHAAGLKFGLHHLDMVVDKSSPLVAPVPREGFLVYPDRRRVLARDIGPHDTFLPTTESPAGLLGGSDRSRFHGRDLRIGDEIVVYEELQTSEPTGFVGCTRGAHGTTAAQHREGAAIDNMAEFTGFYRPDVKSELFAEIRRNLGAVLDRFEVDLLIPDGFGENQLSWPEGPAWYIANLSAAKLFQSTRREVLHTLTPLTGYSWHVFTRGNTRDYVHVGFREYFDRVSLAGAQGRAADLQPAELGWVGFLTHGLDRRATRPRDVDYAWSKALALNAAMSLETTQADLETNGRTAEIFTRMQLWEQLKQNGTVPAKIRERLAQPGSEFTLQSRRPGRWDIVPVKFAEQHGVSGAIGERRPWQVSNPHGAQPLWAEIDARPLLAPYGDAENIVLLEPGRFRLETAGSGPLGRGERQTAGLDFQLSTENESPESGFVEVRATHRGASSAGWGSAEAILETPLDLSAHRGLGTWVEADGSGAVLHFVLEDAGRWNVRDYSIRLDFEGRRYVELPESTGAEVFDFGFPYSGYRALRQIRYDAISRVYVFLTNVSAGSSASARFGRLEALREIHRTIHNPGLSVNGEAILFPTTIGPEGYLEFAPDGTVRVFDPNGVLQGQVRAEGAVPELRPGANELRFFCDDDPNLGTMVHVTIRTTGHPLR